jgi:hypothetical protein
MRRCCLPTSRGIHNSCLPLLFPFVFFDERGAGGKDRRELARKYGLVF